MSAIVSETIEDIIEKVKSPIPPAPDMKDPEIFKIHFELNNKHLGLYYTKHTMN